MLILASVLFIVYSYTITPTKTQSTNTPPDKQDVIIPIDEKQEIITTVAIEAKKPNDPDVEISNKSNYVIEVNGKKEELQPVVKETTKLENNKVVVTQESTVITKIKLPVPIGSFGSGLNNHGQFSIMADGRIYKNLNWWIYGSKTEQSGGIKVTVYK